MRPALKLPLLSNGIPNCGVMFETEDEGANGNGGANNPLEACTLFSDSGGTTGGFTYAAFGAGLIFGMSTFGNVGMFVLFESGAYVFGVRLLKFVDKQLSFRGEVIGKSSWLSTLSGATISGLDPLLQVSEHWEHDEREQFEAEKITV